MDQVHDHHLKKDLTKLFWGRELSDSDAELKQFLMEAYENVNVFRATEKPSTSFRKLYWLLFGIFCLLLADVVFWFLKIPFIYQWVFLIAIACNLLLIFLKKRKERIKNMHQIIRDWEVLPEYWREQFMQSLRAEIQNKLHASGLNSNTLRWIFYGTEMISFMLLIKVIWNDHAFSLRAFFILLLSLVLFVVIHTVISSQDEHAFHQAVDDQTLLRLYHAKLVMSDSRLRLFLLIISSMVAISIVWYFFGNMLSQIWGKIF